MLLPNLGHWRLDRWLIAAVIFLLAVGLLMMASLGSRDMRPLFWFWRQIVWIAVGAFAAGVFAMIDYRIFRNYTSSAIFFYALSVFLLISVLIFGTTINDTKSWFSFGGILFQPVELAKIALILLLAKYFSTKNIELWRFRHIAITGAYVALPAILVMAQPDLGSALVLVAIWLGMTLVSGIHVKQLVILVAIFLLISVFLWTNVLDERQRNRVLAVVKPESVSQSALYNVRQAVIAIGAGGFWGMGLGEGTQSQFRFLPAAKTDFVFASIGEELGFAGIFLTIAAFGILFWRILRVGMSASNNFSRLFSIGFFLLIAVHALINISMNLGLFPVVGIPLPFVSYGGSNLLANFIGLGILVGIQIRGKEK